MASYTAIPVQQQPVYTSVEQPHITSISAGPVVSLGAMPVASTAMPVLSYQQQPAQFAYAMPAQEVEAYVMPQAPPIQFTEPMPETQFEFVANPPKMDPPAVSQTTKMNAKEVDPLLSASSVEQTDFGSDVEDSSRNVKKPGKWKPTKKQQIYGLFGLLACLLCLAGLICFLVWHSNGAGAVAGTTPIPVLMPTTPTPPPDEGFDYIIVGAGAAGMVLAKELAASGLTIALLEGGGPSVTGSYASATPPETTSADPTWAEAASATGQAAPMCFEVPGEYENVAWDLDNGWNTTFSFQGKKSGGSSAVNKQIYVRPTDTQLSAMGFDPSWIPQLKQAYDQIETDMPAVTIPSKDGILYFNKTATLTNEALKGAGFIESQNINDPSLTTGTATRAMHFGLPPQIVKDGARSNSGTVYGPTLEQAKNVYVRLHAEVRRIAWSGTHGHALGVEYMQGNSTCPRCSQPAPYTPKCCTWHMDRLKQTGKIVLAAGALNTPRLLLLSGVGPQADLELYNSRLFLNAIPEQWVQNEFVGMDLQDHIQAIMGFTKDAISNELFNYENRSGNIEAKKQWLTTKSGPYAQYGPTTMAYLISSQEKATSNQADLQVHTLPHAINGQNSVSWILNKPSIMMPTPEPLASQIGAWPTNSWVTYLTLLKTSGKGKIMLDDQTYVQYPPGTYNNTDDYARLADGMSQVAQAVDAYPGFDLQVPASSASSDIQNAVNSWETSHLIVNHFTSSCKLGTCLDATFKVVNTTNVFVADASALPAQPPVQILGTVMALAHMAAGVIASAVVPKPPVWLPTTTQPPTAPAFGTTAAFLSTAVPGAATTVTGVATTLTTTLSGATTIVAGATTLTTTVAGATTVPGATTLAGVTSSTTLTTSSTSSLAAR